MFIRLFATLALFLGSFYAFSHSGGTDGAGCHKDNINGGSHCHGANNSPNKVAPEDFRSSAQTDYEQIQDGFDKKPALKNYVSKRGGEKLFRDKASKLAPTSAPVPNQNELNATVSHDNLNQDEVFHPTLLTEDIQDEPNYSEITNANLDAHPERLQALDNEQPKDGLSKRNIANESRRRKIKKIDYSKKFMVFYNDHCETPLSCVKVPVFTNLKSVMFEYSIRDSK